MMMPSDLERKVWAPGQNVGAADVRAAPSMKPTGWFQVGWSAGIGAGDVLPLRCFGQELVAYRGLDGVLRELGAHVAARRFHPALPDGREHYRDLRVHPQVVAENAVDPHHFRFVHKTPISPVVLDEQVEGPVWRARVGFGRRWAADPHRDPEGNDTLNTLTILWSGLGVSFNAEQLRDGIRVIAICTTPVDDEKSEIFATYWADHVEADAGPRH
jgi:phenylpropionate dioxygenase-like ring-hydroxylating dioxygenase large terminal subunit